MISRDSRRIVKNSSHHDLVDRIGNSVVHLHIDHKWMMKSRISFSRNDHCWGHQFVQISVNNICDLYFHTHCCTLQQSHWKYNLEFQWNFTGKLFGTHHLESKPITVAIHLKIIVGSPFQTKLSSHSKTLGPQPNSQCD